MTTAKTNTLIGSKSSNAMTIAGNWVNSDWMPKRKGLMGYFGKWSKMPRGQRLALVAEARNGFFMVAPVNRWNSVTGKARAAKSRNIALIQSELFIK